MKHKINSINTKQMLVDALITIAEKKPLSKITISELVTYCNINRKTFYYHFTDIYDLLEWHLNNEIEQAISSFDPIYDINITIAYSVNSIQQHSYIKNLIQDSIARDRISKLLNKAIFSQVHHILHTIEQKKHKTLEPDFKEFLAKNFTRIIVLSLLDSIENPNPYDIETLQKHISTLFRLSTEEKRSE